MEVVELGKITGVTVDPETIIQDYRIAFRSRQASLIGRREVMSGKAKFGIFGGGKELAQIAMSKIFRKGDFRAGYYRDQTLMFAIGAATIQEFFAQLYAHADVRAEPATAGRSMNAHFATRSINDTGEWNNLINMFNSSADISPVASQMPRLVGLAYASRLYRELEDLHYLEEFSSNGDEIAFGTIGNAGCAEGIFWESINAIGVLNAPVILTIYDDGYGISVPNEYQLLKQNISELLRGFQRTPDSRDGFDIYTVRGWDYPELISAYHAVGKSVREDRVPALIHVSELTQPQGHSTSGSHERYKTKERLQWEKEYDCNIKFRDWIVQQEISTEDALKNLELEETEYVENIRLEAWEKYIAPIKEDQEKAISLMELIPKSSVHSSELAQIMNNLTHQTTPQRRNIAVGLHQALVLLRDKDIPIKDELVKLRRHIESDGEERYGSHLYSKGDISAVKIPEIPPSFSEQSQTVYGFEVLNACFDAALARDPRVIAFGEDVGRLGDVNQGFRGLQDKYGPLRVSDTGIREATIIGQAIGMAMRGLRPIAEIQYLDYLLYALQIMADDLATLHWRTKGGQRAPVIVRTRGHRLEGVWHSGSPMGGIIHLLRGVNVLVPRNMTQAAGFYNTLLRAEEPGLIIEVLNAYRVKERLPENISEYTTPVGVPEVIREGKDITVVTYGACCRIVMESARILSKLDIDLEIIDVRSLLPFDINNTTRDSLKKTGSILFVDEDVPGGATAFMMQEVIEKQGGYHWLDSGPRTLTGKAHRPAYGSDGDYWSKPNVEQVVELIVEMMNETNPARHPVIN